MATKSKKNLGVEKDNQAAGGNSGEALLVEKPPGRSKRGSYKQKECPYCHAHVGNLGNHIRLKHPAAAKEKIELTKEDLLAGKAKPLSDEPTYYCIDCKAELRKDENPCWHCGKYLDWTGVK